MKNNYWVVFIIIASALVIFNCKKEKKDDTLMNLVVLTSLAEAAKGPSCVNCYCNVNADATIKTSPAYCIKYTNLLGENEAKDDCTKANGTFTTTACSSVNVYSYCKNSSKEASFYSIPESSTLYINTATEIANACNKFGGTQTYSTANPKVRFKNSSGSTETYTIHSSANCGTSTIVKTISTNVTDGSTTDYVELQNTQTITVNNGSTSVRTNFYAISYDGGTTCSEPKYVFSKGIQWTITSGKSAYTISAP